MLTYFGPVGREMKRFRITPSSDTSLATMSAGAPSKVEAGNAPSEKKTFTIKKDLTPAQAAALEKWKNLNAVRAKRGLPELPPPRELREE